MTEQRAASVDDTSWAPATGGFFADDTPFGSVLGDPLMGSPLFDVSVLDATPGSQPEDDALFQDRSTLSDEERAQVARADRIKAGAARRDAAHRQTKGSSRRQPPQQPAPAAPGYGYVPTAQPGLRPGAPQPGPLPGVPQPGVPSPAEMERMVRQVMGPARPRPTPFTPGPGGYGRPRPQGRPVVPPSARQGQPGPTRSTGTQPAPNKKGSLLPGILFAIFCLVVGRACAG